MTTICFDLDGTLTDPRIGITRSIQHALEQLGHVAPSTDQLLWCIGPPLLGSFEKLLKDRDEAKTALALYRERFSSIGIYENEVYDGIRDALAKLVSSKQRLLVATSKPTVFAGRIIEHFGLSEFFEAICGSELDGTRSDKSELLAWIVSEQGLSTRDTTMFGDRSHDIIGARNNGIATVGVLYGYGTREELLSAGADALCQSPVELPRIILKR